MQSDFLAILFPNERDEEAIPLPDECKRNATPEDDTDFENMDEPADPAESRAAGQPKAAIAAWSSCALLPCGLG